MNAHDQPPAASAVETETIDDRAAASVLSPGGDANRYEPSTGATARLRSLDAVRGLAIVVMLLAMHPGPQDDPVQLEHPAWHGLRFVDLFFPLFLFSVGVSMAFSSRASNGRQMLRRAALLALLGIAVGSLKHEHFALTGVLQHVAGASVVAFAVLRAPRRWQAPIAAAIVAMVWAGFLIWAAGRDPWGRSDTLAHAVDGALLGGFTSEGVIQTLISSVTVIGGALAGRLIREVPDRGRLVRLIATRGLALIGGGMLLAVLVPLNKRLWSPSFAVLTVGTSYAWLAIGMWLIDVRGHRRWAGPLVHLGTNPIVVYVLFMAVLALLNNFAGAAFPTLTPAGSETLGALVYATAWTVLWWSFAYLLFRHRIFIKV
ncbi:MAG: acyltransferase family protein [Acidimicrobiales bacterium]